jgi:hypothetical protein
LNTKYTAFAGCPPGSDTSHVRGLVDPSELRQLRMLLFIHLADGKVIYLGAVNKEVLLKETRDGSSEICCTAVAPTGV